MISKTDAILVWRAAAKAEIGVAVENQGDSIRQVMNLLYEIRKELNDPELADIGIFLPGDTAKGEIWLCKKEVELD